MILYAQYSICEEENEKRRETYEAQRFLCTSDAKAIKLITKLKRRRENAGCDQKNGLHHRSLCKKKADPQK